MADETTTFKDIDGVAPTVGEAVDYVEQVLCDERMNDYGGPNAFLGAVEEAEKQGENRVSVLKHVRERSE